MTALAVVLTGACSAVDPVETSSTSSTLPAVPVSVAAQNEFYTQPVSCGAVTASVVSLNGSWFLQRGTITPSYPYGMTHDEFLAATEHDVACRLGQYLANHPGPNTGGDASGFDSQLRPEKCGGQCPTRCRVSTDARTIIIDIEDPHLRDLQDFGTSPTSPERIAVVNAFKARAAATRAVFPNAKLGFYGTLVPDGRGRADDPEYQANKQALFFAARYQGLLSHTNYLVPVLYTRFGCDDESANRCPACDGNWDTLASMTQLGLEGSRYIDPYRPLLPVLGFGVNNANSCFRRKLFLDFGLDDPVGATLEKQIDIIRKHAMSGSSVAQIVLWAGSNTPALPSTDADDPEPWMNPNAWSVKDYTDELCTP